MALELRQQLKLTQQLIMTPQLQMAIKLLQLSRLELMDTIRQELEENPALEEVSETAAESLTTEKEGSPAEEKSAYTVVLADGGAQKIQVIKAVRELNPNLGLKEAKEVVDSAPKEVLTDVDKESADKAKEKLEAAGAKVELK